MWTKKHKYLLNGILLFLLISMLSSITAIKADNTLSPLYNYFAFGEKGTITKGLSNESYVSEAGYRVNEILSKQDAYKFRFIFSVPDNPFEILSLRVRMIFTENITEVIRWGFARNVSVSVYPFELATIDGVNNSALVLDALELYHGKEVQFHFNTTAFEELEYFELAFSSWNATPNLRGVQFEQINFHLLPENVFTATTLIVILSSAGLFGVSILCPARFKGVFLILLAFILLLVPLALVLQVKNILDSHPQAEKGVSRFTFFGRVYERRDLGNGFFSLRMVKDLTKAFELKALSGTGSKVVYPIILNETEILENESVSTTPTNNNYASDNDKSNQKSSGSLHGQYFTPNYVVANMDGNPLWWNSSYTYVKQVTISANSALSTSYTAQVDFNTASLISASKMRTDVKDLRVVYFNETDSAWYELDRVVLNKNTEKTSVFFRIQKDILATNTDPNYAIYYGIKSGDPGVPKSNTTKIFLDYDDFSSGDLSGYNSSTDWTATTESTKPTDIGWWSNTNIASHTGVTWSDLNRTNILTTDHQVLVLQRTANTLTESGIALRSTGGSDWIYLGHNNTGIGVKRYNGSITYDFSSSSGGFSSSSWYLYKYQITGSGLLKGKYWIAGNAEPTSWTLQTNQNGIPSSGHLIFTSSNTGTYVGMWALMEAVSTPPSITVANEEKEVPEITGVSVTNADSGVIHSKRQYYDFQVQLTEGYNKTNIVQLNFTVNSFEYSVVYNNITDLFSEYADPSDHFTLDTTGGSYISRSGKSLTVVFKILTDWDFPNGVNIQLNAFANDTLSNSTSGNSAINYTFNHDIQVSPFTVDDNHINPAYPSNLNFDGSVNYTGSIIPVPNSEIDAIAIIKDVGNVDVSVGVINATTSLFSIEVDSETDVGIYTYYPYVKYAGDSLTWNGSVTTTLNVNVDRVEITAITITANKSYDSSTQIHWEDNDASGDAFTITITAKWEYAGTDYLGEVRIGYVGNNESYGPTSGLARTDVEEDPALGSISPVRDVTVGSAVVGVNNDYGTEIYITASLPKIAWDNDPPNIAHDPSATNESSDYLYYNEASNYGYYSDNMGVTADTFNVGGTASDVGSGLQEITDDTDFGGNPSRSGSLSTWSFGYSINQDNSTYGTITVTYTAKDFVGNTGSTTFQFRIDNINPNLASLDLLLIADSDSVGNGITPDTGYYDDDSVNVLITGGPSDSGGSGLPTDAYCYRTDDGSYNSSWYSGGGTIVSVNHGSRTIYVRVRDYVGNIATDIDSVAVVVDLAPPSGYTSTIHEINNFQYIYAPDGTTVYFNGAYDDIWFDVEINDVGTEDNFWKVRFPDAFADGQEEDDIAPYRRVTDYDIDSTDVGRTIDVLVIDRAGRSQTITITVTEDSTAPTLGTLNLELTADTDSVGNGITPDTGYYDDNSVEVTISGSPTDGGSGLPTERYSYKYDGGSYGSWVSGGTTLNSVPEGNRNITVRVRDNVENIKELDFV
ncbi:MAG: hypothetical protein ACFE9L_10435, partial [Candidatus Hodarchaeota archaeon]